MSPVFAASSVIVGSYFGNQSVIDAPATPVPLDSDAKQISFSFQQQTTDLITAVWVHGTTVGACPQYSAMIHDDDGGGLPVTTTNLGGDSGNMVNGWTKIAFLGPV